MEFELLHQQQTAAQASIIAFQQAQQTQTQQNVQAYQQMGEAFGNAMVSFTDGAESAKEAIKSMLGTVISAIREQAIKAIMANAANAASGAAASQASTPVIGPALAVAAATAMFAFASGFVAKLKHGGIVKGGTPGRDSVPALLAPGEAVIPADQVRRMRRGGGPTVQVNVSESPFVPRSTAEMTRLVRREVKGAIEELIQVRLLKPARGMPTL